MNLRKDTYKKVFFLVVGPLRGGGGKLPEPLRKKHTFILSLKKRSKPNEPIRPEGDGGYPDLSGPTTKKTI